MVDQATSGRPLGESSAAPEFDVVGMSTDRYRHLWRGEVDTRDRRIGGELRLAGFVGVV